MRVKRNGRWDTLTWREYREQARLTARGLIALGLEPKQGVSIIGFNCPQWFFADVGAILAGGIPAGIYTTNSPEQCQYIADHSDSSIAVAENVEQLQKFLAVRDQLPKLKALVLMYGEHPEATSWEQLLEMGRQLPESVLDERIAAQKATDTATLIYTSGTTGNPKAVMISHDNITWTAEVVTDIYRTIHREKLPHEEFDVSTISYLPLSHVAEQIVSLHAPMAAAGVTAFAESIEALGDNLREVHPTIFFAVPRVWEKIQAKIVAAAQNNSDLLKMISRFARSRGLKGGYAEQSGRRKPLGFGLANKLVFTKVRDRLGLDRCYGQLTSAAPISKETLEFFLSLGIPIYEVYGMSECTGPATVSTPAAYKTGKVGRVLPGAELKIAEDGEVCMRGRHVFQGYYKNPEATAETIDSEGWLHSGDIGEIDADGYLQITGRKKDLIITSGGENIAPQVLENLFKSIAVVSQVVVIGDGRKFVSALFTLDEEKISQVASQIGSPATDCRSASQCSLFYKHIELEVAQVNEQLANVQRIKKFRLLPEDFTIEGGELTPTMKIKRRVVTEKYAQEIELIYQ